MLEFAGQIAVDQLVTGEFMRVSKAAALGGDAARAQALAEISALLPGANVLCPGHIGTAEHSPGPVKPRDPRSCVVCPFCVAIGQTQTHITEPAKIVLHHTNRRNNPNPAMHTAVNKRPAYA